MKSKEYNKNKTREQEFKELGDRFDKILYELNNIGLAHLELNNKKEMICL